MKKKYFISVNIAFLLLCNNVFSQQLDTICGKLELSNNPCVSIPCTPGVVLNVVQNETYYVLVHNNSWIDELPFIWNSKSYNEGDSIKIIGFVYQKTDSLENSFFELEISNVISSILSKKNNFVNIYPNPVVNELYIESSDQLIKDIFIYSINGILLFRSNNINQFTYIIPYNFSFQQTLCHVYFNKDHKIIRKIIKSNCHE